MDKIITFNTNTYNVGTATINKSNKSRNRKEKQEQLYIDTAEAEHIEMYLKAIWSISERK
jgi:hypothetical protein